MFPRLRKSSRWRRHAERLPFTSPAFSVSKATPDPELLVEVAESEAPELRWIHGGGDGSYYLAPDSAPPLPTGMWSELDPIKVQDADEAVSKLWGEEDWQVGSPDADVRASLKDDGELGEAVIDLLDAQWGPGGSRDP